MAMKEVSQLDAKPESSAREREAQGKDDRLYREYYRATCVALLAIVSHQALGQLFVWKASLNNVCTTHTLLFPAISYRSSNTP